MAPLYPREAVTWATGAGAVTVEVLHAWAVGTTVDVPVGRQWDVVRVTAPVGWPVLAELRAAGVELGPVLEAARGPVLEVPVILGTARSWPALPRTVCTGRGALRAPAPWACTGRCTGVGGRRWAVPPGPGTAPHTDADALCEAIAVQLARHSKAVATVFPHRPTHAGGPAS